MRDFPFFLCLVARIAKYGRQCSRESCRCGRLIEEGAKRTGPERMLKRKEGLKIERAREKAIEILEIILKIKAIQDRVRKQ